MVKMKCQVCGQEGLLQRVGKSYCRIRHYQGVNPMTKKPKFSYCQQSLEYVEAQLRILNGKDLFQSNQSNIATGCIDPELDQGIIDPEKSNSSSEIENKHCRGSLAWLGRQTHNLENKRWPNARCPEVAGSNPAPGTTIETSFLQDSCVFQVFFKKKEGLELLSADRSLSFSVALIPLRVFQHAFRLKNCQYG